MLESAVESKLKWLEGFGFEVLKFKTPGYNGTKDRLILWPTWSPAPPVMVEIKRPGKSERPLQAAVRDNWRKRGCDVRDMCDTIEKVQMLCDILLIEAYFRSTVKLPDRIINGYNQAWKRARAVNLTYSKYDAATRQFKG